MLMSFIGSRVVTMGPIQKTNFRSVSAHMQGNCFRRRLLVQRDMSLLLFNTPRKNRKTFIVLIIDKGMQEKFITEGICKQNES